MEETISFCANAQCTQSKRVLSPRSGHEPFDGGKILQLSEAIPILPFPSFVIQVAKVGQPNHHYSS
jgi:hypothetical protein